MNAKRPSAETTFRVTVIVIAVLVGVAFGWLYRAGHQQTVANHRAIMAACTSSNANRKIQRRVLRTLRDLHTIQLTPAEMRKRTHTYNKLIASVVLERCS